MAKGKRKRHGSSPAAPSKEEILGELETKANEIASGDPAAAGPLWGAVHKLLLKTNADPGEAAALIARRDTDGLATMARVLRGEESAEPAEEASRAQVPAETMAKALRAVRKRLKLGRLDHE